jgi:KDO2-lipid IV(A) lauroyltransferase
MDFLVYVIFLILEKTLVKFERSAVISEKLKEGKGLVIISAHFGNWELLAYGGSRIAEVPFNVIVKEQTNKFIDKEINCIRKSAGNKMVDMNMGIRDILWLLRNNRVVALLSDQSAPKESTVRTNFFIKDVPAFEGAARFALKTGAEVLFGASVRNRDGSYNVAVREIDMSKYKDYSEENIRKLTQEHVNILVEFINLYPDHWLWFHKKFKHSVDY